MTHFPAGGYNLLLEVKKFAGREVVWLALRPSIQLVAWLWVETLVLFFTPK